MNLGKDSRGSTAQGHFDNAVCSPAFLAPVKKSSGLDSGPAGIKNSDSKKRSGTYIRCVLIERMRKNLPPGRASLTGPRLPFPRLRSLG